MAAVFVFSIAGLAVIVPYPLINATDGASRRRVTGNRVTALGETHPRASGRQDHRHLLRVDRLDDGVRCHRRPKSNQCARAAIRRLLIRNRTPLHAAARCWRVLSTAAAGQAGATDAKRTAARLGGVMGLSQRRTTKGGVYFGQLHRTSQAQAR